MLLDNIKIAKKNIESNCSNDVTLIAATKTVPSEIINTLPSLGITIAGENRVQELLSKYDDVKGISWHFIGRLQRNKVKYIVDKVDMIHSVDSVALADEINKQCAKIGRIMSVLVEINMGEQAKGGVSIDEVIALADYVDSLPFLQLKGVMCVLPIAADEQMYQSVYEIFDKLKHKYNHANVLSMGMSGDYITAVKHGANMVRLGSCLFGQRIYK